jgi:hypothetical protein
MSIQSIEACIGRDENGDFYVFVAGEWIYCGSEHDAIARFLYELEREDKRARSLKMT